jgi:HK97 family phage portal protein
VSKKVTIKANFMANIFQREFWVRGQKREMSPQQTGVPVTTDPNDPSNQPVKSADWESKVVNPYGRRSLLIPAWYRGVSLIMQTMGQMVTQYQRLDTEGGNFTEDRGYLDRRRTIPTDGNRLNYLLQVRPNPLMTASQLQEQIEYRKVYYGNAYVYIERGEYGEPIALWLCTGGGFNPITNRYSLVYNSTRGPRMKVEADAKDVMHFKNVFLTEDYYMGIPTLDYAFKALQIAGTADEQALQDVAKGGRHKVLLQEEKAPNGGGTRGRANSQELRRTAKRFGEDWAAGDVVILDNVMNPQIISQTSQQLQLLEQRSFQVSDLARILGVPRIMMMEDAGSSYKMPEHATQEFMLRTIQPRIREWEDEMNAKLLTADDWGKRRIHVCELPLRRLDAKGQAEIDRIHLETGWTTNQILAQYDLPNVENGDEPMASANLMTLKALMAKGAEAQQGGRPTTTQLAEPNPNGGDGAEEGNDDE